LMRLQSSYVTYSTADTFAYIHDCKVTGWPHNIIAVEGILARPLVFIEYDTLEVDATNDLYSYNSGNACHSSGDGTAIDVYGASPGSRITGCKITSGTAREGGQGILIQGAIGTEADSIVIDSNWVDVWNGPNDVTSIGICAAIYIRYAPSSAYTSNEYVKIRDNFLRTWVDADAETDYMGTTAETISAILCGGFTGNDTTNYARHIVFEHNTVICTTAVGVDENDVDPAAIGWGAYDSLGLAAAGTRPSGDNISLENHYRSPRQPVKICNMRGYQGNQAFFDGDTIELVDDHDSTIAFDYRGAYLRHSRDNIFRDINWAGYSDEDNIGWHTNDASNDSLGLSVRYERTVTLLIRDDNFNSVVDADVWAVDGYGHEQCRGISGPEGSFDALVSYKFRAYDKKPTDSYVLSDSLGYNDIVFYAAKDGDTASVALTVGMGTGTQMLTLNGSQAASAARKIRILRMED